MAQAIERNGIQVIARAAEVLRMLESETEVLGQLARCVNLARSTVRRLTSPLVDERFLMPASDRGRARLGPELVRALC